MNRYIIYGLLVVGISIAAYFLLKALKRIITGLKNLAELGAEEFMRRLKDGAERISPLQKTKAELNGIVISFIGLVVGFVATPIIRIEGVWFWVEIVLTGSLILTGTQLLSKLQLHAIQKKQDEVMKSLELEEEE